MAKAATANVMNKKVTIPEFKKEAIMVTIEGDSDLLLCKMTDEAAEGIKDNQTKSSKAASKAKEAINMYQRLIQSVHWMDVPNSSAKFNIYDENGNPVEVCMGDHMTDGQYNFTELGWRGALETNRIGYDASGIKKGLCDAAVRVLGESKSTIINANLQVIPEKRNLVPIEFASAGYDESIITNWKGNAFLTYRNVFSGWKATFRIEYLPTNISMEQVITLVQAMGFANGLGAHRVGLKGGTNGQFHVSEVIQVA
jgi:hypothetical protein